MIRAYVIRLGTLCAEDYSDTACCVYIPYQLLVKMYSKDCTEMRSIDRMVQDRIGNSHYQLIPIYKKDDKFYVYHFDMPDLSITVPLASQERQGSG